MAIGVALVTTAFLIAVNWPGCGAASSERAPDEASPADPALSRLRAAPAARRVVPAGAIDVIVVERGTGTAVPDVEVLLRGDLADAERDAVSATTDAEGRVRLKGQFPGFVELRSATWTSDPMRVAVDEKTTLRVEAFARTPLALRLVDETTGLAAPGWRIGAVGADGTDGGVPALGDAAGETSIAWRGRAPEVLAGTDGQHHVRTFLLTPVRGRAGARLEIPRPTRSTLVRCLDESGRALVGAALCVSSAASGVAVACDERGEASIEYGAREAVTLVATAPARAARRVRLTGAPSATVVLEPTTTRVLRLRSADGTRVPDGVRLRGFTRGPEGYGIDGVAIEFSGRTTAETCEVADLPAGPFDAWVEATGEGVATLARVHGTDDASRPIEWVVGPARGFRVEGVPCASDGSAGTAVVRIDGVTTCAADAATAARDLDETFAHGRPIDALGACFVVRGPVAEFSLPRSTEPRRVELSTASGRFACFVVAPEDAGGTRAPPFVDVRGRDDVAPTILRVEWPGGGQAELLALDVHGDERHAASISALTDSTGVAALPLAPGRYVVEASADAVRYVGELPLLVPAAGEVVVRLRATGR